MPNLPVVSSYSMVIHLKWMYRPFARLRVALICLLCVLPVAAQQSVDKNVQLLLSSEDFRVRTQAALALGASKSERAVGPLCGSLADGHRTVRIASATALSRLKLGGRDCLTRRLSQESDARVLASIKRALTTLGGAEPTIGPATRYWVAVQKIAGPERLDEPVRHAMVKAVEARDEFAFVPREVTLSEAEQVLKAHPDATGFSLAPKLNRPTYAGGMLKVQMSIAIMSYPGNALIGSFTKTVGMAGVSEPDQASENELILLAAAEAMKQFVTLAPTMCR